MKLKLVAIGESGLPIEPIRALTEIALDVCASMASLYKSQGFALPWIGYLALAVERPDAPMVVSTCAFKSPPDAGVVEIAYFTFPGFEGRGYATAMAKELVSMAQNALPELMDVAHTLPQTNASTSILQKLHFELRGSVINPGDGEVWQWTLLAPS